MKKEDNPNVETAYIFILEEARKPPRGKKNPGIFLIYALYSA